MRSFFKIFVCIFLILGCASIEVHSQEKVSDLFERYNRENPNEKIYAHLNRNEHITGEILWFKIYSLDNSAHLPLDISRIAYAEILDIDNKVMLQTKVSLYEGVGSGSFFIPATIPSGYYVFRAYTNWMKNSQPEYFFYKKITIINTLKENDSPLNPNSFSTAVDLQFLPEGGHLLEGIPTKIGVKVINQSGQGINCSGAILNNRQDTVARFKATKYGLGSFSFTAQPGQEYRAVMLNKKITTKISFPEIKKSGFSLSVQDMEGNKLKIITSNPDGIFKAQLLIHTRQSIKVTEIISTRDKQYELIIDKHKLGDGISHITIFDQDNKPVCERLYFKKPENTVDLTLKVDQKEYSTRRRVQLNIPNEQQVSGNFSVSVFNGDSTAGKESIINYLLLTSDLTGFVEDPEFYFSNDPDAAQAADNLMLTQGWRRFKWEAIVQKQKPVIQFLPEIKGHIIHGQILDNQKNPLKGLNAYLATPGKKIRLYVSKSDSSGMVRFQMKDFQETGKIIAQTDYETDSLSHLEIFSPFSNQYKSWRSSYLTLNNALEEGLIDRSVGMQIQDAFYEDETYFKFKKDPIDSIPFYGKANEVYYLDDYTRFPVLEEVFREFIKGVWVRKRNENFRFMVIDKRRNELFKENPLTLLDGVPMFNINKVLAIDPLRIKKVEVVTNRYFFGPLMLDGLVSLSTYNGDLGGIELDPRSVSLDYEGLQSQREFYSPRYNSPELRGSRLPDQRYQLYWNPNISAAGKDINLDFYTSDVEGNFYVVLEGISSTGIPVFNTTSFKVSR